MFWRLPPSVRSLCFSNIRPYSSSKTVDPLRILFCGSDEFSSISLHALHRAKSENPELIASIDVIHRPGKRTGRGLKTIREGMGSPISMVEHQLTAKSVPIKQVAADELKLPTHIIDTFTGWTPPKPLDLIIAVSFGLFVPPRILNSAKYGGLNVHPSLLPDLRGPAPIHHTLLKRRSHTGVTIQTLHPKHFDQGTILAQTPSPGVLVPPIVDAHAWGPTGLLTQTLGELGGQMLVDVLRTRAFIPPIPDAGWYSQSDGPVEHAEKITPAHRYIDFSTATAEDLLTRDKVLGHLWCDCSGTRIIVDALQDTPFVDGVANREPGLYLIKMSQQVSSIYSPDLPHLVMRLSGGRVLEVSKSTAAGGKKGMGNHHVEQKLEASSRWLPSEELLTF